MWGCACELPGSGRVPLSFAVDELGPVCSAVRVQEEVVDDRAVDGLLLEQACGQAVEGRAGTGQELGGPYLGGTEQPTDLVVHPLLRCFGVRPVDRRRIEMCR